MLTCKEATRLVSESLDHKLPLRQQMAVWIHLLMCKFCARYRKQLLMLRDLAEHSFYLEEMQPHVALPQEARERIQRSLKQLRSV
ncbi:MAG: zf-HC2 domain-containing protein [Deltaproteobacteria bacterium]|nr:zf-HC2 domain-containing protein [Deltaproteobacteria bacterium]